MEAIPRNDGEQYRFDAFCKAVLRNEARNYHRNKKRLLDREKSFSVLSLEELGQLTSVDHYPSEEFIFSSYGCDLHLDNELVANAFAALPKQEQSILDSVLRSGTGRWRDWRPHGNVPECCTAPPDKNAERAAKKAKGALAGGRLGVNELL